MTQCTVMNILFIIPTCAIPLNNPDYTGVRLITQTDMMQNVLCGVLAAGQVYMPQAIPQSGASFLPLMNR